MIRSIDDNRLKRLKRNEFIKLSRELHAKARELGVKMKVHYRPLIFNENRRNSGSCTAHVYGYYDIKEKKIVVTVRGRPGRAKILFALAHELRHAIHDHEGMYKGYYRDVSDLWEWTRGEINKRPKTKPLCRATAVKAERDCDNWAGKYLTERGIPCKVKEAYPYDGTIAYDLGLAIKERECQLKKKQSKN